MRDQGASAAPVGVGLGALQPPRPLLARCLPDTSQSTPPLRSPQCPLSPVASVQWESRWVIGSRLKILIIHEAGEGLGGWGWLPGWGWGGEVTSQGELANNSGKGREGGRERQRVHV